MYPMEVDDALCFAVNNQQTPPANMHLGLLARTQATGLKAPLVSQDGEHQSPALTTPKSNHDVLDFGFRLAPPSNGGREDDGLLKQKGEK